jgi:outer membrane protein
MFRTAALILAGSAILCAEVRPMTLRQTVETALKQNPDIALARLDEEKARQAVRLAKDPFLPRIAVGSGLAKTYGFPMSIDGAAPSVVQANATAYLFNRQQNYVVAQAKEDVRGASIAVTSKRDEVAYRAAALYLDAERAARIGALARKDFDSLQKVLDAVQAQVREGRALPLTEKQAALNLAKSRATAEALEDDQATTETALALALGFAATDRVRPSDGERPVPALPASEEEALRAALDSNKDLRRLESQMVAKQLEMKGARAARLPRADLVAQYGLFARFNNFDEYFNRFQHNNGQIGVSLQLPIFTGPGVSAQISQATTDVARLRVEYSNARNRLNSDLQTAFRDARRAQTNAEVARLDLDLAREALSVNLAQMEEGRATLRQVEEARLMENGKWIAFYDAQYAVEKAKWNVLRLTGELSAAIENLR